MCCHNRIIEHNVIINTKNFMRETARSPPPGYPGPRLVGGGGRYPSPSWGYPSHTLVWYPCSNHTQFQAGVPQSHLGEGYSCLWTPQAGPVTRLGYPSGKDQRPGNPPGRILDQRPGYPAKRTWDQRSKYPQIGHGTRAEVPLRKDRGTEAGKAN